MTFCTFDRKRLFFKPVSIGISLKNIFSDPFLLEFPQKTLFQAVPIGTGTNLISAVTFGTG
ncbi:hypothetical protein HMPREF9151_01782 [Hoylesella saccharolytica F0055]|uniref:Uncharacterized protein n=1 Tax=Hoylesella saccharolytica F0055 TaxID=1127699 RepID=L1N7G2_9BACT|nr:hypothetical protein HMPREF9151_01782 [Hoylesella saccharolytica F0055]